MTPDHPSLPEFARETQDRRQDTGSWVGQVWDAIDALKAELDQVKNALARRQQMLSSIQSAVAPIPSPEYRVTGL